MEQFLVNQSRERTLMSIGARKEAPWLFLKVMNCGKILQAQTLCLLKNQLSKPMAYRNKIIDRKADDLTLTVQWEKGHFYTHCNELRPNVPLNLKPEWLKVPDAVRVFGLGRSTIYNLIKANKIKSFSKRQRGALRGTRLISYDSLVEHLEEEYQNSLKPSEVQKQDGGAENE